MTKRVIRVVAAAIIHNGKVFVAKRSTSGDEFGKWELPGGKIETQESPQEALKREISEELGWDIIVGKLLSQNTVELLDKTIQLNVYYAELSNQKKGVPQLNAHSEYQWLLPCDLIIENFPAADQPALLKLKNVQ